MLWLDCLSFTGLFRVRGGRSLGGFPTGSREPLEGRSRSVRGSGERDGEGLTFQHSKALSEDKEMGILKMQVWGLERFRGGDMGKISFWFAFTSTFFVS